MSDYFRRDLTYDDAPQGSKNEDWAPGETEESIQAAIARIRADLAAAAPEPNQPYAVMEWYHGNRVVTGDELALYERRAAERGAAKAEVTIEHTARQAPAPLGITTRKARVTRRRPIHRLMCQHCGVVMEASISTKKWCSRACQARGARGERAA